MATPIGNLEDITLRALRVLRECDVVAAEDTRHSGQLLKHFGISKPLLSYFQFNEARRERGNTGTAAAGGKSRVGDGRRDARASAIRGRGWLRRRWRRDCGWKRCRGHARWWRRLTASGLPTDEFHFVGFLPHKSGQRRRQLEALRAVPGTLILYESPYRIVKLLEELAELYPDAAGRSWRGN